jgi:hypothetical protein
MSRKTLAVPALLCLVALASGCAPSTDARAPGASGTTAAPPQQVGATSGDSAPASSGLGGVPSPKKSTTTSDWPANNDCVTYHPDNLTVSGSGASGTFLVTDGGTVVIRVHGQTDDVGTQALALAQRYTTHCYLGRTNNRDPKGDYIFDYWRNPSGRTTTITGETDLCSPYNNRNLTVEDMGGGDGWRVKDHDHVLHLFDNQTDANNGALVLRKYSQVCAIGDVQDNDSNLGQVDYQR